MTLLKTLLNHLRINCWIRGKHEWVEYSDYHLCSRCPAVKLKEKI